MSIVGFRSNNHPQQVAKKGANPSVDDRRTDPELFRKLNLRFDFTVDVAASAENTQCKNYYDEAANGLLIDWSGERVWCNPPYSDIRPWVEKTWSEFEQETQPWLVVMLLPANRTEQGWWQDLIEPRRDKTDSILSVEFLRGRQRFIHAGKTAIGPNERPPFGCCLAIWENA